jgi:exonuclease SbcC
MKIQKIKIQNFKVLREKEIDFESSDLVVFDGPNGFGKTSIYDAIELLFTGKIRRYNVLQLLLIDGRESYHEHPFYNEGATGDISICIEFTKNGSTYILERLAKKEELTNSINFSTYNLFEKASFEATDKNLIENEEEFLKNILGANYKENFQFLNYIEQEDSLFLLKSQDKNRKQYISHLFNVLEFENKIASINVIKQKIEVLCNAKEKKEIEEIEAEIKQTKDFLSKSFQDIEYIKLFPEREFIWDEKEFDFKSIDYLDILGEDGILTKLNSLLNHKESFRKYIYNETIDTLLRNDSTLKDFCQFYSFIPEKDNLILSRDLYIKKQQYLEKLENLSTDDLRDEFLEFDFNDFDFLNSHLIEDFFESFEILKTDLLALNNLEGIYSKINESRQRLIEKIEELKENDLTIGSCFLCGYDWGDITTLLENINLQSENLESVASISSKVFKEKFDSFKINVVSQIITILSQNITDNNIDKEFINKLVSFEPTHFNNIIKYFDKIDFDYGSYLNNVIKIDIELKFETLNSDLKAKKYEIVIEEIEPYFKEYFNEFFDNNFDTLDAFDLKNVKAKIDYLKYTYSLLQNDFLTVKTQELRAKQNKFDNAKALSEQIKQLKNIYEYSLRKYQKKVIKDIEIIFHIYSGRIMQDFQGGLGLFIYSDKNGIRFQTNPSKTFDAIFSMSSGQLSTLIIAFTLALHKKYSQNKIILIDDPVQTMDELNVVGFIELLRNEFSKNQIIISTHEDMMSVFMRYKFKNYNLTQKRINLKALEQSAN